MASASQRSPESSSLVSCQCDITPALCGTIDSLLARSPATGALRHFESPRSGEVARRDGDARRIIPDEEAPGGAAVNRVRDSTSRLAGTVPVEWQA